MRPLHTKNTGMLPHRHHARGQSARPTSMQSHPKQPHVRLDNSRQRTEGGTLARCLADAHRAAIARSASTILLAQSLDRSSNVPTTPHAGASAGGSLQQKRQIRAQGKATRSGRGRTSTVPSIRPTGYLK